MAIRSNKPVNHSLQAPAVGGSLPETELSRAFEEWSAATIATTGDLPDPHGETADRLGRFILNQDAATPADAAIKLRVTLHSLFVSDAKSMFPDQCAALSTVVEDLERQEAAGRFARRTDAGQDFVRAWRAFSGY